MRARSAPLDIGSSAALRDAEQSAREQERRKWQVRVRCACAFLARLRVHFGSCAQLELERVKTEGARLINEAKERGKAQYNELVASIEQQYMSEFESSVSDIRLKTEADLQV